MRLLATVCACLCVIAGCGWARTQSFPTDDPVIHRMWEVGVENSQTHVLAQFLMDVIGPRTSGSPNLAAAQEWLLETYGSWGVPARKEQYGTWLGWRQGILHVDLIAPRVQSLEAKLLAYSPGTDGPVEGEIVALPTVVPSNFDVSQWLPFVEGRWVLVSPPEPMCRPAEFLESLARPETVASLKALQEENRTRHQRWVDEVGWDFGHLLDEAGALGIIESRWFGGWGTFRIEESFLKNLDIPYVALSCEDYGLVYRLAENNQNPRLRIEAEVEQLGEVPQFNVIAELTGTELPDEYVLLSAHLDSFHGATGATDNGTGTIMMLEAMRILKATYPNPRRTIRVGHWGGEEFGLIGSNSYREDHPEVVDGLQALFNQDNGTWRIERIEGQGFLYAGQYLSRWISQVPRELSERITLVFPGGQDFRGSDQRSFLCVGAPAFRLDGARDEHHTEHRRYTRHGNRDTYDKIVFDDLKENATLAAMLAYAASEDPDRVPRDRATLPIDPDTGEPREWARCPPGPRTWAEWDP